MGSLSEFTAEIRKSNFARPYLYYVEIFAPLAVLTDGKTYNNNMVNMFCAGASTPQTDMYTNDDNHENGIRRKYIYDYNHQNLVLQFYVDQKYETKYFFDNWLKQIVPSARKFNYYDDYRSPLIRVTVLNTAGKDTYQYYYMGAVPKTVNNIDLAYSGHGSVSTFNVEFVFETITFNKIEPGSTVDVAPPTVESPTYALTDNLEMAQLFNLNFNESEWI